MQDLLLYAKAAAYEAGAYLKKYFLSHPLGAEFSLKGKEQLVTQADVESNRLITKLLTKSTGYEVMSEEGKTQIPETEYFWVVDPLDGTTNFAAHNPFFNVSIALAQRVGDSYEIKLGVVYAPMFDMIFYATDQTKAFLNGSALSLAPLKNMKEKVHGFCYGSKADKYFKIAARYYEHLLLEGYSIRQFGAAALEISLVAAGVLGSMYIPGAYPWDVAAASLIAKQAGAVVLGLDFMPWTLQSEGIVVANPGIIKEVKDKIIKVNNELERESF